MNPRAALAPVVVGALLLVAAVGGSSPGSQYVQEARTRDLLASAHPSAAQPWVSDAAYDVTRLRGWTTKADTAALTSTTCDGCNGESTALHVVYVPHARTTTLDNVATAWAQGCQRCNGTALSVQVVVVGGGGPTVVPDNRALAVNAACEQCRSSAVAYQVVMVSDRVVPLTADEMASLRAWFDDQAAGLRAAMLEMPADPLPPTVTPTTAEPSPTATAEPTKTDTPLPSPTLPTSSVRAVAPDPRRLRTDARAALVDLEALLSSALPGEVVAADVDVSR